MYFEQTATWDHRDSVLEPRQGYYLSIGIQEGATNELLANGDTLFRPDFFRILPEARAYYRLEELWNDVPAVALDAAAV